ncbi:phage holin [Bacillus sp. V5-8f]|uniref:phage holin n=1 Tax=Bacillus sp. V5-8f TaxID=2053044 RepID=UPI000C7904AC|nr:phage holin [Bacillus sp. V5-8f]PLT35512.1 phage holin [Bacillus sp. V5-8f]
MINWKLRFRNPTWIVTVGIPSALILAQMILAFINKFIYPIGFTISNDALNGFLQIVNFFAITFLGIGGVVDPTTKGISDSERAKNYTDPQ